MQPIHELLARIRWDADFGKSRFVIGYWDRIERKILHADLREVAWDADNPGLFHLIDDDGVCHGIPFHRVREVWRDGTLIWLRHGAGKGDARQDSKRPVADSPPGHDRRYRSER